MMTRYQNGKIYTIRSFQTDKYYIGSTCLQLHKRFYQHKQSYKSYQNNKHHFVTSFEIVKYDDCYIELLEEYKCENKNQLTKREGELIREYKNECVNKFIPTRTHKEYRDEHKEQRKQYRDEHKEQTKQYNKQYNKLNMK